MEVYLYEKGQFKALLKTVPPENVRVFLDSWADGGWGSLESIYQEILIKQLKQLDCHRVIPDIEVLAWLRGHLVK